MKNMKTALAAVARLSGGLERMKWGISLTDREKVKRGGGQASHDTKC
jgi:hypothetical protein